MEVVVKIQMDKKFNSAGGPDSVDKQLPNPVMHHFVVKQRRKTCKLTRTHLKYVCFSFLSNYLLHYLDRLIMKEQDLPPQPRNQ